MLSCFSYSTDFAMQCQSSLSMSADEYISRSLVYRKDLFLLKTRVWKKTLCIPLWLLTGTTTVIEPDSQTTSLQHIKL